MRGARTHKGGSGRKETHVLAGVEDGPALADEDVSGDHVFVCGGARDTMRTACGVSSSTAAATGRWGGGEGGSADAPENFLTPSRLPGEPPWLLTVPPARFVAVLTLPRPARGHNVCHARRPRRAWREGAHSPAGLNGAWSAAALRHKAWRDIAVAA